MTIYDIIAKAEALQNETALGAISPERVGQIQTETLKYLNEAQIFADSLVHKIYTNEAAFSNDTERLSDLTGRPMMAGQLLYIQSLRQFWRYDGDNRRTLIGESICQSDWMASEDETGFIKNRTHYLRIGDLHTIPNTGRGTFAEILHLNDYTKIYHKGLNKIIDISYDGQEHIVSHDPWFTYKVVDNAYLHVSSDIVSSVAIVLNINKLEENYIPDTIARKDEIPIANSSVDNSAMLKGGNNKVISEHSVALGKDNFVGLKGWYYKALRFNKTDNLLYVFFSNKQVIPTIGQPSIIEKIDMTHFEVGDIVSVVNDVKYDNQFKIKTVHSQYLILEPISGELPFSDIKTELLLDPEDYSIYILDKPDSGMFDMGQSSFASGCHNKATNGKSTVFGFNNHSWGKFSFVEGRDNEAGYSAHAEGRETKAIGNHSHSEGHVTEAAGISSHAEGSHTKALNTTSHAEGYYSIASGVDSHAEGYSTEASGLRSHAEGSQNKATEHGSHVEGVSNESRGVGSHVEGLYNVGSGRASHTEGENNRTNGDRSHAEGSHTVTNNNAEHAQGKYNKSNTNTIHSVGIGTSDSDRKNAHEIDNDGRHYILGIGGYDGTNPSEAKDVATVINELVSIINQITLKVEE